MNSDLHSDSDLKALLSQWKPEGSLPPRFAEGVWRRIEVPEVVSFWQFAQSWVERTFARPAVGVAYCALLIAAGLGLGTWRSHHQSALTQAELETRYVQAISPYHKVHQ